MDDTSISSCFMLYLTQEAVRQLDYRQIFQVKTDTSHFLLTSLNIRIQKKVKLDEDDEDDDEDDEDDDDDDFDEEETEEKVPVKKSVRDTPAKNAQKSNQNGKDLKPSTPRSKGQESFKKQEKTPKTPKGPSSVEDIKAKMQASIEKGGSLPKVEAKFINYVKNCFRMTDQEAIQDLWQWRKSL
ncbi:nucleophosmin-like [Mus musculus]|uniref:nucleophosmin-like n=1 Tax=Mus musculus TaxID=10090 RepID=UPI00006083B9|nr:nucleophosmin-like [Mus musculus]